MNRLQSTIRNLVRNYGSLRAAARALDIDAGYLSRMARGVKVNPSPATLAKLRLEKVSTYRPKGEWQ